MTRVLPTLRGRLDHGSGCSDEDGVVLSDVEGGRGLELVSRWEICFRCLELHTLTEYQSLRVKGSWVFFFKPFLPFERRLFLLSFVRPRPIEHRDPHIQANSIQVCNRTASRAAPAKRARENSLSDSHDCEKLPCRGAVEVERCCRDAVGGGEERFNRIVKCFPKCVRLGCVSLELSENSVLGGGAIAACLCLTGDKYHFWCREDEQKLGATHKIVIDELCFCLC